MKKLFPILLAFLLLVGSVVPAFALEQPSDSNRVLHGVYEFNDQASLPSMDVGESYTVNFPVLDLAPLDMYGQVIISITVSCEANGISCKYKYKNGIITGENVFFQKGKFTSNAMITFHVPYDFTSSDDAMGVWEFLGHNVWQIEEFTECDGTYHTTKDVDLDYYCDLCFLQIPRTICDGSACAWADADLNGICDTCGLALFGFRYDLLDYAYIQKDVGISNFTDHIFWLITEGQDFENTEAYIIYISNLPFHFINGNLKSAGTTQRTIVSYNSSGVPAGTGWTSIPANTNLPYGSPVDSSVNIDGFFPPVGENPGTGEGGDTPTPDEGGEGNDDNVTLLDRLLGIYNFLKSITTDIAGIPQIAFNLFSDILYKISDTLTGLPKQILDGIRDIFIPDADEIQAKFFNFIENLKVKFNFDTDFFTGLFNTETPVEDITTQYYIHGVGNFYLKLLDTKYFVQGVEFFRPFIRGVLVLFMGFYNVRMGLSFIRQDAGVVSGKVAGKKEE